MLVTIIGFQTESKIYIKKHIVIYALSCVFIVAFKKLAVILNL